MATSQHCQRRVTFDVQTLNAYRQMTVLIPPGWPIPVREQSVHEPDRIIASIKTYEPDLVLAFPKNFVDMIRHGFDAQYVSSVAGPAVHGGSPVGLPLQARRWQAARIAQR